MIFRHHNPFANTYGKEQHIITVSFFSNSLNHNETKVHADERSGTPAKFSALLLCRAPHGPAPAQGFQCTVSFLEEDAGQPMSVLVRAVNQRLGAMYWYRLILFT